MEKWLNEKEQKVEHKRVAAGLLIFAAVFVGICVTISTLREKEERPAPTIAKSYSEKGVSDFVMNYTMHGTKPQGFTIKAVTDLTVRLLREEGSQAYVTEPKAEDLGVKTN